ncbi:MAG: DUF563 domain-containing protein [Gammaproteobacteria bacterium]
MGKSTTKTQQETTIHEWATDELRPMDADYFRMANAKIVEDEVLENGHVSTKHTYQVRNLVGGLSYTNAVTHRSVYDSAGNRIESLSSSRTGTKVPTVLRIPVKRKISGVTANLYGTVASAEGNYFHWFFDAMARIFIIQNFHSPNSIDNVLVPPLMYDFQWESLAALGFDRSKIIELEPLKCLQFDCLLASSAPRGKGSAICPGWSIEKYRNVLLPSANTQRSPVGKRIYISRRDAPNRMFINETAVCDYMYSQGFDVIELTPFSLWEKIAIFRDAELIVGQTGAGLTNLMFCTPNTEVLELVDTRFVYPLYASLVNHIGAKHKAHFFSTEENLIQSDAILTRATLNIDELSKSLASL